MEVLEEYRDLVDKENDRNLQQAFDKFRDGVTNAIQKNDYRDSSTYGFLHEIKTYFFLKNLGLKFKMANASKPGPDFILEKCYLECCTSGFGEDKQLEIICETAPRVGVYNKDGVALRLLNSISSKKDKYKYYISSPEKQIVDPNIPYVLFISYGMMENSIFEYDRTRKHEILLPLLGVGDFALILDLNTGECKGTTNVEKLSVNKAPGVEVDTCAFHDGVLSAVIVTSADLGKEYMQSNTVVFYNPFAKNKISLDLFSGLNYWIDIGGNNYKLHEYPLSK